MVDKFEPKCAKQFSDKRTEHKTNKELYKAAWAACNALKDCEVIKYHTNGGGSHPFFYELFGSCKFEGSCVDKNSCSNTIKKCVPDRGKHSSYRVYVKKTSLQEKGR